MLPEVQEYLLHESKIPVSVKAERPFILTVEYNDGEKRCLDMEPMLHGVFEELRDFDLFSKASTDGRCIMWNTPSYGIVDIDKDALYIYGERPVSDPFCSGSSMESLEKSVLELREGKGTEYKSIDPDE
ncbi:MAG: DUF2442 domain-containing protein [Clostridia bacterium]|nr:DUF2442 domain-containing protein [Clostridia bacterium]